jgi:hypothetical protein
MTTQRELDAEKKFYERFWALHNNERLLQVFKMFGPAAFRRSSVLEGFEAFIRAQGFQGKRCVEIGTFKGITALVLAQHFDEVVSIDIAPDPMKHEIAAAVGATNIRFVDVKDNLEKARYIRTLQFDAGYSDGNHVHDAGDDFALLMRGGRVMFHEYWEAQPPVWKLVNELRNRNGAAAVAVSGKLALWTCPYGRVDPAI